MLDIQLFNGQLFLQILIIGLLSGTFSTLFTEKWKDIPFIKQSWQVAIFSFLINLIFGFAWTLVLTELFVPNLIGIITCILIGLCGFIGAELFYSQFKEKLNIFQPLADRNNK